MNIELIIVGMSVLIGVVVGLIGGWLLVEGPGKDRMWRLNHELSRTVARQKRTIDDVEYARDDTHGLLFYLYQYHAVDMEEHFREEAESQLREYLGMTDEELGELMENSIRYSELRSKK